MLDTRHGVLQGFNWPFQSCLTNFLGLHVGQAFSPGSWCLASSPSSFLKIHQPLHFPFSWCQLPRHYPLVKHRCLATLPRGSGSAPLMCRPPAQLCEGPGRGSKRKAHYALNRRSWLRYRNKQWEIWGWGGAGPTFLLWFTEWTVCLLFLKFYRSEDNYRS